MRHKFGILVASTILLILVSLGFLLGSQLGLTTGIKLLQRMLPGKLTIAHAQGHLLSNFTLSQVNYQTASSQISLSKLSLDWQAWQLITGKLPVQGFKAEQISLVQHDKLKKVYQTLKLTELNAQGVVGLTANGPFDLQANWQGLSLTHNDQAYLEKGHGRLNTHGLRNNFHWQALANLSSKVLPSSTWQLNGHGNNSKFWLENGVTELLNGRITSKGWLDIQDVPAWQIHLQADHLDPAVQWSNLTGELNFHLSSEGRLAKAIQHTLQIDRLNGQLGGQPLKGSALLKTLGENVQALNVQLSAGDTHATIEGQIDQVWSLRWLIEAADFRRLMANAHGSLRSSGIVIGERSQPLIKIDTQARNLQIARYSLNYFDAKGFINLDRHKASQFDLSLDTALLNGFKIDHADFSLRGSFAQQQLQGTVNLPTERYGLMLTAQQKPDHWLIHMPKFSLQSTRFGTWQLANPLQARVSAEQLLVQPFCWHTTQQKICLQQAFWQHNANWGLELNAQKLDLALLKPWLNNELNLAGHADLAIDLKNQQQATDLKANLDIGVLHVRYGLDKATTHSFIVHDIKANAIMQQSGLQTTLKAILLDQPLNASLELPNYNHFAPLKAQQPWQGQASFTLNDLSILTAMLPSLTDVQGLLQMSLQLGGTLGKPSLSGKALLSQAGFKLPNFGTQIEQLQGSATSRADGKIDYEFTAKAGSDSHLKLAGNLNLFSTPITSRTALTGEHALIINTEQYQVIANPDLLLATHGPQLKLTGTITIPQAELKPSNFSQQVVELPEDMVIMGKQQVTTGTTVPLHTEIKLKLGDKVTVDSKGLKGRIEGNLIINDKPNHPTTATGQLNILKGTYNVYGENLIIRNGRLVYAGGNIDNPGLSILAARTINTSLLEELVVGVNVQGRLKQPKVNLFSEPANLSQADILSYILTGAPVNQLSGAKGQLLFKAATALNPGNDQLGNIKKDLQNSLGLDELDVGNVQQYSKEKGMMVQNTSLMVGKQLTPRLHIGYSMGIVEHINTFTARFQLWRKLLLQTQTTLDNSGVDVIYTYERK